MADWGDFPPITLSEDSEVPKYLQFALALERSIVEGLIPPHTRLPSENQFFDLLNLSRSTIRKSLESIEAKGLLVRRQGQGTFTVDPRKPLKDLPGEDPRPVPDKPKPRTHLHQVHPINGPAVKGLIGLLVPSMANEIYPQIVQGVEDVAAERGYTVFIGNTYIDRNRERALIQQMIERNVNGLILEPTNAMTDQPGTETFRLLQDITIPTVLLDNDIHGLDLSRVMLNDLEGGRLATSYLLSKGHRRIAYVHPKEVIAANDRLEGYQSALEHAGVVHRVPLVEAYSEDQIHQVPGYRCTMALLNRLERPTAIFYFNDELAFQGMQAIRDAGLSIPGDISVIGFDNVLSSGNCHPPLTSIEHPKYYSGRWAADILFDQIESRANPIKRRIMIYPELVERESCAPCLAP